MQKHLYKILLIFIFYSCVKDKPQNPSQPAVQLSNNKKVYVVNEGNYMSANSSVSLYDPGTKQVIEDFYQTQNNATVGDVAQSISFFNSNFYIVVNNSNKVLICDNSLKNTATISGFTSPRYILQVTNSKAYVSDLFSNYISVVNLNSNSISAVIPCPGWTEKMILIYNKVFVTNMKRNFVYIINSVNDIKTDSIEVGPSAGSILLDRNDNIWVLSGGDKPNSITPSLKRINPVTNAVEKTFTFTLNDAPGNLCINKTKDTLYFLNNGIYRMAITDLALPGNVFVAKGTKNFYGLGINHNDFTIYAADALDYISRSNIYIYNSSGEEKSNFKAGLNSGNFYFE